jgi:uncharacterized protein (TIGR02594 family)
VRALQQRLVSLRFDVGGVDGVFGPKTLAAVQAFQRAQGLAVDGVVGPRTAGALDLELAAPAPAPSSPKQPTPSLPVSGEPAWLVFARSEIGQKELKGTQQNNGRILQYHATTTYHAKTDETAWCSSFVNWCLLQAGFKGTNSAAAASWGQWGVASSAQPGAIAVVVFGENSKSPGDHVGFLLEETATYVKLLGGNQSNQVRVTSFPKSGTEACRVKHYRWPSDAGKPPAPPLGKAGNKGTGQVADLQKGSASAFVEKFVSMMTMDEEGLAQALYGKGKDVKLVTAVFKLLDDKYNSDADDVAVEYVQLVKSRAGAPLEMLKREGPLRELIVQILASGVMATDELKAIQYLRGLTGGAGTTRPAASGDKIRDSDITVGGKHFVDWFNQDFQPTQTGKHPTLKLHGKPVMKFPCKVSKEAFATVLDNCADFWASELTLNEFLGFFGVIYQETGGSFLPISELGGMKYMFESIVNAKASYNGPPNRRAGDLLRARGVIAANDVSTFNAWNSTTTYPNPQDPNLERHARECDFWKYRGRGLIQITWRDNYLKHVEPYLVARGYKKCDELTEEELGRIIKTDARVYLPMVKSYFSASKTSVAKVNEASPDWNAMGSCVNGKAYGELLHWRCATLLAAMKQAGYQLTGGAASSSTAKPVKTPPKPKPQQPVASVGTGSLSYAEISKNFRVKIPGSQYFTWHEALYLPSWSRYAKANEVTPTILQNIVRQAKALDRVREHFKKPIVVHCWLRPPAYNAEVDGAPKSSHLNGNATDFHFEGLATDEARRILIANRSIYPGAGELKVGWMHLDLEHSEWFDPTRKKKR